MFNVRLAGGHLYGKQLFTWLSLVVSLIASFVLSFFPLDVLDEIWDLIESVSEGFLTYTSTHRVWQNLETVADVRKAVIKVRFLTGVYMLQSSKHVFSNKTVDPNCRLCQLDVEDIRHMVALCPAFHSIRASTLIKLREVISEHRDIINVDFWDCILKGFWQQISFHLF